MTNWKSKTPLRPRITKNAGGRLERLIAPLACLIWWIGLGVTSAANAQAPGLSYSTDQMIQRMIQLAEGPIPTRAELESEFGFEFKLSGVNGGGATYYSAAEHPFMGIQGARDATITYNEFFTGTSIYFRFERAEWGKPKPKYCMSNQMFFSSIPSRWHRHQVVRNPHRQIEVHYSANIGGVPRKIFAAPVDLVGEKCVYTIAIEFLKSLTPASKGSEK